MPAKPCCPVSVGTISISNPPVTARASAANARFAPGGALSPPDESENRQLSGRPADFRLACRSRVQGPVTATLEQGESKMQTVFTLENPAGRVESPVSRIALPEVDRSNGRPYLEGLPFHSSDPEVLSRIAGWERTGKPAWGIVLENELIDVVLEETPLLGAAVDVGTTGLSPVSVRPGKRRASRPEFGPESPNGVRRRRHHPHHLLPGTTGRSSNAPKGPAGRSGRHAGPGPWARITGGSRFIWRRWRPTPPCCTFWPE